MKTTRLGEFEELVLLAVVRLQTRACCIEIKSELEKALAERLSIGSIQLLIRHCFHPESLQNLNVIFAA